MAGPTTTTPKLWVRSDANVYTDAGSTLATNTQSSEQWNDQSGNGNHATQPTSGFRSNFATNRFNGLPSLQFSRASTQYFINAFTGDPKTIFVVGANTETSGSHNGCWLGGKGDGSVNVDAYYFASSGDPGGQSMSFSRATSADSGSATDWVGAINRMPSGQFHVQAGRQNGTSIELWVNGAIIGSKTSSNTPRAITAAVIGGAYYEQSLTLFGGNWLQGEICEILMYDTVLSDAEMAQVHAYLVGRYGSTIDNTNYTYPSFDGTSETLRILGSADGVYFGDILSAAFTPHTGTVRDPSLIQFNGKFWLPYTSIGLSGSWSTFGLASATSREGPYTWQQDVDCSGLSGANAVWSPTGFIDINGSKYILVSISTTGTSGNFKLYYLSTPDFVTFSAPQEITGVNASYPNAIAGYIVNKGGTYYLWLKDQSASYNVVMSSSSPFSGYTPLDTGNWAGWGTAFEGAYPIPLGGSNWRVYMDNFGVTVTGPDYNGGECHSDSTDNWATWSTPAQCPAKGGLRNGIILQKAPSTIAYLDRPLRGLTRGLCKGAT